jgi:hypothetical protein
MIFLFFLLVEFVSCPIRANTFERAYSIVSPFYLFFSEEKKTVLYPHCMAHVRT